MTTACVLTLGLSLVLYLAATLLFQGSFLLRKTGWESLGRRALLVGVSVHVFGMVLHATLSGQSPFSSLLVIISWLIIALLGGALLAEHYTRVRYLSLLAAPLAFLALLYPMLMPVELANRDHVLVQYPWLGVHVVLSLLGYVGFARAFCTAAAYLLQQRALKRGRLNHYLPALEPRQLRPFALPGSDSLFSHWAWGWVLSGCLAHPVRTCRDPTPRYGWRSPRGLSSPTTYTRAASIDSRAVASSGL